MIRKGVIAVTWAVGVGLLIVSVCTIMLPEDWEDVGLGAWLASVVLWVLYCVMVFFEVKGKRVK